MQSAQLEMLPEEAADADDALAKHGLRAETYSLHSSSALKQEVAGLLAAHRQRRGLETPDLTRSERKVAERRSDKKSGIAQAVRERYAQSPSYRAFLAQAAERAIEEAAAAAAVAQRNADAVAAVQGELLAELEQWTSPQEFTSATARTIAKAPVAPDRNAAFPNAIAPNQDAQSLGAKPMLPPLRPVESSALTVRLYEDDGRAFNMRAEMPADRVRGQAQRQGLDAEEARALDEEIAFRQAPVFEEYRIEPTVPLPANLLEFPRQLVAARRARPRLAEGPLREESAPRTPQLRIFEVQPEQISTIPPTASALPEWNSIWLDAHTVTPQFEDLNQQAPALAASSAPHTAPLELRMMATAVDGLLVAAALVAFCAAAAEVAGRLPTGGAAVAAAVGTFLALYVIYQMLFFTLNSQTPGMRYARIGLCTFSDENPTRAAMRRRILAQAVALCPLGLGFVWALLDDDRLGWHDRISRMYQRAY